MKRRKDGYYEQTDNVSCGPIAILNALKYAKKENSNFQEIRKKCKTGRNGTDIENFENTLKTLLPYKRSVSLRNIEKSVNSGKSMILLRPDNDITFSGHFLFIDSSKYCVKTINSMLNWVQLLEHITKYRGLGKTIGWIIDI